MHIIIKKSIFNESEIPTSLKECLEKIDSDIIGKGIVNRYESVFTLDKYQVSFTVDKFEIEFKNLKVWAMMKLYYGFEIDYDFIDKLFKIGGYETKELTSKTISGLLRKIEKEFGKQNE